MRTAVRMAIAGLLLAMTGAVPAGADETVPARLQKPLSVDRPDQALFGEAVLRYSNAARRAHGQPPLRADIGLSRAAARHAVNMARLRTHSHELPIRGEAKLAQRLKRQSTGFRLAAENIAKEKVYQLLGRPISTRSAGCSFIYGDTGQPVPIHTYASLAEQAVARWLRSPRHRASLLSPSFRRHGAGVGVDPSGPACGDVYVVQDFAD